MKLLLLTAFMFSALLSSAQQNDFFLVKKRSGKTEQSFFAGQYISLITKDKDGYSGYIKKIARDSLWVEYRDVFRNMTHIGSIILDTVTYEARRFAINDIAAIEKEHNGFAQVTLSALMKVGGAGYILLHTVTSLYQKEKISIRNLGIAAGVYLAGVVLNKLKKDHYHIGKRYRIQYVSLSSNTSQ